MFSGCDIRPVLSPGSITCSTALVAAGPEEPRKYEDLLDNARRWNCKFLKPLSSKMLACYTARQLALLAVRSPRFRDKMTSPRQHHPVARIHSSRIPEGMVHRIRGFSVSTTAVWATFVVMLFSDDMLSYTEHGSLSAFRACIRVSRHEHI
jgi:hypothetical protein